jgi:hypothetical protein
LNFCTDRTTRLIRIQRELKLRQRIYKFAELSDKEERKRRFAFLIAEKRLAAERQYTSQLSESGELDSDSNLDVETDKENSFPNPQENVTKPFDSRELNLGIIIGILIGLCFGLVFSSQEHFHLFTLLKK